MAGAPPDDPRQVYFEFTVIGPTVRVAAIDGLTGTEVVVMGPRSARRADLEKVAANKLKAKLAGRAG
jgi:hypothetical protein